MITKILKIFFLAFGLALVCLGLFYNYQQEKPLEEGLSNSPSPAGQLETYTLSNNAYSGKAVEEVQFNNPANEESTLIYRLNDFPESEEGPERINTAGYAEEFKALEEATAASNSREIGNFPVLLIFGGVVMFAFGFFSFRIEQQKKQAF